MPARAAHPDMWRQLTGSLWFVPGLFVLGAIGLATTMVELSASIDPATLARFPRLFGAGAGGARSMLATIAGSMITVAGVTFSVTVVAVAQASSQYTPRILRNFMRDRANQVVLGLLVGVFAYCLVVLRTIRGGDELLFVPSVAVLVAVLLTFVAIGGFVFFIHHITETLEAGSILARISRETVRAVDRLFPEELGNERSGALEPLPDDGAWCVVNAATSGYVQSVDSEGMVRYAEQYSTVVRMERGVGDFVVEGSALASVAGFEPDKHNIAALRALYTLSDHRTVDQDAAFGVRQMVDMGTKALSPGVNDTTTAITCIEHLRVVLTRLARRRVTERYRTTGRALRVIAIGPTFESLLGDAVHEIRQSAAGNARVFVHLLNLLASVGRQVSDEDRRESLRAHAELILRSAREGIVLEEDFAVVAAAHERLASVLGTGLFSHRDSRL
ncbi:MAG: DUF2254 domain-containing protein [Gemmatimonadaceae bacterium]